MSALYSIHRGWSERSAEKPTTRKVLVVATCCVLGNENKTLVSSLSETVLYAASLVLSLPHPAFGHPLPRGEGLGVRGQRAAPMRN